MAQATQRRVDKQFPELNYEFIDNKLVVTGDNSGKKFRTFAYLNRGLQVYEAKCFAIVHANTAYLQWLDKHNLTLVPTYYVCKECNEKKTIKGYRLDDVGTRVRTCNVCIGNRAIRCKKKRGIK